MVVVTLALLLHPVVDDQVAAAAPELVCVLLCDCLVLLVDHQWRVVVCGENINIDQDDLDFMTNLSCVLCVTCGS